jgi:LPS sulfotransferase NodH
MRIISVLPFDGTEFDAPPDATPARTQTYVVCATPRSGSGLLCNALGATGVAGTPLEYFNPVRRSVLSRRWGCGSELAAYAQALTERRTGSTGVFGTKLHWEQLEALRAETLGRARPGEAPFGQRAKLLEDLLGGRLTYVHILRQDIDRQAISLWIAEQTGAFSRREAPRSSSRVAYSFAGIRRCRHRIALGELHWNRFFRLNGVEPLEVVYENLCASYTPAVAAVLDRLVPGATAEIPPPMTVRLADDQSEQLLERFLRDLGRRHPLSFRERLERRVRARLRRR